jgi:hypothetical protein
MPLNTGAYGYANDEKEEALPIKTGSGKRTRTHRSTPTN